MNLPAMDVSRLDAMPREARRWVPVVWGVTRNSLVDPALVFAVMHTESGFDPMARSRTGACGLMQLIPGTGARTAVAYLTGRQYSIPEAALFRPRLNILLGVAYLEWLWTRKFWSILPDICRTLLCVAAYNAGPTRINRWLTNHGLSRRATLATNHLATESLLDTLTTTLPWRETRSFVRSVAGRWPRYRAWLGLPRAASSADF